jgi:uncharacterized protein (TIGR03083 family)
MAGNDETWQLIHSERAALADTLDTLSEDQWEAPSLCEGWTVKITAAHILAGAEQTGPGFLRGMVASGFRFNAMMDRDARRIGTLEHREIVARLRERMTTTNHPPAPVKAMLGEVVVHGADICQPLGLPTPSSTDATVACLDMFKDASFPVGGKKRVAGVRMIATDTDWSHGFGPEISGPAASLLLVMTGRDAGLETVRGEGVALMRTRLSGPQGTSGRGR